MAYSFGLVILNKQFEEIQIFALDDGFEYNEVNLPSKFCSILLMNEPKTYMYWLKDNDQIVKIDNRTYQFVKIYKNIVRLGKS